MTRETLIARITSARMAGDHDQAVKLWMVYGGDCEINFRQFSEIWKEPEPQRDQSKSGRKKGEATRRREEMKAS